MFYDYAELEDGTQIAYSSTLEDNTVEISIERPVDSGFDSARCLLPSLSWLSVEGFSDNELSKLENFIEKNTPLLLRFAREASKTYA